MNRLLVAATLAIALSLAVEAVAPSTPFLLPSTVATWWAHPHPLSLHGSVPSQRLVFTGTTQGGRLQIAAMSRFRLFVGHRELTVTPPSNWKRLSVVDVPAGEIRVVAEHDRLRPVLGLGGPAAPELLTVDDGLEQHDAVPVAALYGARSPLSAWMARSAQFAGFSIVAGVAILGIAFRRRTVDVRDVARPKLVVAIVAVHAVLALWNLTQFPIERGLDAEGHREFIALIAEHGTIPTPESGWQTYHPPLYHALAAAAQRVTGSDHAAQALSALSGIALVALVASGLGAQRWRGTLLISALPVLLLSEPQATNEVLFACLATIALLSAATLDPGHRSWIATGIGTGCALLTKYTAALIAPAALFGLLAPVKTWRKRLLTSAVFVAVAVLVGGLPYLVRLENWGDPFIGNWNDALGHPYRQPPGIRTVAYFTRFGAALVAHPFEARVASMWDSLYVSTFADGFGRFITSSSQHWACAALVWLALPLVATCLLGLGDVVLGRGERDRLDDVGALAVGLVLASLIRFNLELPYWSTAKGVFLLGLSLPLACAFERGRSRLVSRGGPIARDLLDATLGCFAILSALTFAYR